LSSHSRIRPLGTLVGAWRTEQSSASVQLTEDLQLVATLVAKDQHRRLEQSGLLPPLSNLPVLGPLINRYIRYKMFPPVMVEQWLRHQVEEVSSLSFFWLRFMSSGTRRMGILFWIFNKQVRF